MRLVGPPAPPPRAPTVSALVARAARAPTIAGSRAASGVTFVDLRERETFVSWGEVHRRARRVAAALASRGVAPGERVAIVLRTEPAFLDVFFGALLAGAVPVPLYPPVRLGRMDEYVAATARMVSVAGATALVAGGAVRRLLGEVVARALPARGCFDAADLAAGTEELTREVAPEDLALVQFSSGSTVDPKPVALTHAAIVAHVEVLLGLLQPGDDDALVSWLPLYHDMGLIGGLLGALAHPGPAVLIPPEHFLARPALWLRAVSRHRGTIAAAPSFAYAYCLQRVGDDQLEGVDLGSWRVALNGAEPVSLRAARDFQRRFARVGFRADALRPVYGLSEAALAVTFTGPRAELASARLDPAALAETGEIRDGPREVASVGSPVPGVEVEVRDELGAPAGEGRLGRIWVRGPSVMRGYLGQPESTARALERGWLDTGDLGFVRGGELYVHGREKDVVVIRGANHAPDHLESALEGVAGSRPGCAVAVGFDPDGDGEALLLLVERRREAGDDGALEAAVRRAVTERTGVEPHTVVLLDPGTLPRTSSGKMRRREALRRWQAGTLTAPRPVTPLAMAREVARSALGYARARRARGGRGG